MKRKNSCTKGWIFAKTCGHSYRRGTVLVLTGRDEFRGVVCRKLSVTERLNRHTARGRSVLDGAPATRKLAGNAPPFEAALPLLRLNRAAARFTKGMPFEPAAGRPSGQECRFAALILGRSGAPTYNECGLRPQVRPATAGRHPEIQRRALSWSGRVRTYLPADPVAVRC